MAIYVADGATIGRGDGASPEVFTTIAQVRTIGTVGLNRGLIDVTNLSSAAREYKKAIVDGQEISLSIQYDPDDTGHAGLRTDCSAEVSRNYRITLTDSPAQTITFAAMAMNWTLSGIEIDNVIMLSCTLKPSGALTFA